MKIGSFSDLVILLNKHKITSFTKVLCLVPSRVQIRQLRIWRELVQFKLSVFGAQNLKDILIDLINFYTHLIVPIDTNTDNRSLINYFFMSFCLPICSLLISILLRHFSKKSFVKITSKECYKTGLKTDIFQVISGLHRLDIWYFE